MDESIDPSPLRQLETLDGYRSGFTDLALWQPFVLAVCRRHGLEPCRPVRTTLPGTCPTFIAGERWVLKFFGRLFEGEQAFRVEQEAARLLNDQANLPLPRLEASGRLFTGADGWPWPYLVFEYIPGVSIGEVYAQVSPESRLDMARQVGGWARALHAVPVAGSPVFPDHWEGYLRFLEGQRQGCADRHRQWGSLPPHLIDQIDAYLLPSIELIDPAEPPHLIHADLTADHLLGRVDSGGRWHTLALIDFGDAMTGSLLYELCALHFDLFKANRALLEAFLTSYGRRPPAFARRAMSTALLHAFDMFANLPELGKSETLAGLAEAIWE